MNETTIESLIRGIDRVCEPDEHNMDVMMLIEAKALLENKEKYLDEYDCYDYLFE